MNKIIIGRITKDMYADPWGIVEIFKEGQEVYVLAKIIDKKKESYPSGIGYVVIFQDMKNGDTDSSYIEVNDTDLPVFLSSG